MTDTEPTTEPAPPADESPDPQPEGDTRAAPADLALTDAPFTFRTLRAIADTEFVPADLRGDVNALLACILTGRELGIGPMESMRSIHIIDGRPTPSAEWMLSRIFEAGHLMWPLEQSATSVTVHAQRRDAAGQVLAEASFTFTIEMAKRANLTHKFNWKAYPEAMLYWRAVSQLARQMFPDVLHGIRYTLDEMGDGDWHRPIPSHDFEPTPGGVIFDTDTGEIRPRTADDEPVTAGGGRRLFTSDDDDDVIDAEVVEEGPTVHEHEIQAHKDLVALAGGDIRLAKKLWDAATPGVDTLESHEAIDAAYHRALEGLRAHQAGEPSAAGQMDMEEATA